MSWSLQDAIEINKKIRPVDLICNDFLFLSLLYKNRVLEELKFVLMLNLLNSVLKFHLIFSWFIQNFSHGNFTHFERGRKEQAESVLKYENKRKN